jgi:two-component sensor histidine kinase
LKLIQQKDEQKNILIAEIHHRVKNNLQYVRSMLEMQLSIVAEEKDKHNLEDVSRRIQAMSLVHEMLYNKEETTGINLSEYLNQLFQYLLIGFSSSNQPKLQIAIPPIEVSISEATSLGIVCAELFNNSVKYAFINHPNPLFVLDVALNQDTIILLVKDNGENFSVPSNSQDKNRQKLGLRIIDIFARQLKATYQIDKEKGYRFELRYTRSKVE